MKSLILSLVIVSAICAMGFWGVRLHAEKQLHELTPAQIANLDAWL